MDVDKEIRENRLLYREYWRERSDLFWMWKLFHEVIELALSLIRLLHRHPPEWELKQIASIASNWLEKIHETSN